MILFSKTLDIMVIYIILNFTDILTYFQDISYNLNSIFLIILIFFSIQNLLLYFIPFNNLI